MKDQYDSKLEAAVEKAAIDLENRRLVEKYERKLANQSGAKKERSNKLLPIVLGLLVLSLLFFALFNNSLKSNIENSDSPYYIAALEFNSNPENNLRGDASVSMSKILEAENLIANGQIVEAMKIFDSIELDSLSSQNKLTMIQACLKLGENGKASTLINALNSSQNNIKQEVQWLQILNLIEVGQIEKAKPLMDHVISNREYKWQEVQKLRNTFK